MTRHAKQRCAHGFDQLVQRQDVCAAPLQGEVQRPPAWCAKSELRPWGCWLSAMHTKFKQPVFLLDGPLVFDQVVVGDVFHLAKFDASDHRL